MIVDARPWGRIESIIDSVSGETIDLPKGSPFTPRLAELAAGTYEVTVGHPDGSSKTCKVEIDSTTTARCEVQFFEPVAPRQYFREVGW